MSKSWPKVIRDPVHNIITFENTECDRLLLDLINTREFQRLRRIKQLGLCDMVFPAANHSRFAHSIGVMQNARQFLDRISRLSGKIDKNHRMLVCVAALLHDIGHGPFSHAFEKVTGDSHERRTLEIIRDDSTEVHQLLRAIDPKLPEHMALFFDEDIEDDQLENAPFPPFLTQIVSSQLDADRFDYLVRDSHSTGTGYGVFDRDWLLQHLCVKEIKPKKKSAVNLAGRFYLSSKALFAAEAYVFARFHMYRMVYFHKTIRAAEVMLRLVFQRFKELLIKSDSKAARNNVVPGSTPGLVRAFSKASSPIPLEEYLRLDDFSVTEFLKCCGRSKDKYLKELGLGLIGRRLYKATDATDAASSDVGHFTSKATEKIRKLHGDTDYSFVPDTPTDTPYKPYDPDAEKPATQIYVENSLSELKELSSVVEAVETLKKKYTLVRYYYPESIREDIDLIAKETLRKE
jgi:uncharacterized protein